MTGALTQYSLNKAVNVAVGNDESAAAAMYIALATALPTGPGTASLAAFGTHEITTSGYSRQAVTWGTPAGGTISNAGTVLFGPFSADPPNVPYIWECDTSLGISGNVLAYWTLGTALDAANGDYIQISPGDMTMAISACP